ncbi:MAG: PVC-type heme-binding CxxCH protein [Planctomycetaceae bacterium]
MQTRRVSAMAPFLFALAIAPPLAPARSDDAPRSLAEQLPRIAPVEPEKALATFHVERGFRLELVACEPDVIDPIAACFDERGRMFVAEMRSYPFSHEKGPTQTDRVGKKDADTIRLLEDTDGDGRFDKSVLFADGLNWPTGLVCHRGGLFVIAPPHLYYLKDADGDGKADVREVVYSGFGRENVQALANNLAWGLDNRIYAAGATNRAELSHRGKPLLTLGRRDLRFDPDTEKLEAISGGVQFGNSFDDWGNRFLSSNSNHIQHAPFDARYLERNPHYGFSNAVRSIAADGPAGPVYRRSPPEPWRIVRQKQRAAAAGFELVRKDDGTWEFVPVEGKRAGSRPEYPIGYFTSATGVTIFRGGAYPDEFQGNAFIGDVGGNLVHRKTLEPSGPTFIARRADERTEFVSSTDTWFRPVNFANAPDGTLYVLDMYRETIEHPYSIPPEIKKHLDLESGDDRGRIYRLAAPEWKFAPPPDLGRMTTAELVAQLESPNAWNRETAQRLIRERAEKAAVAPLRQLASESQSPLARLHALWTLDGLDALDAALSIAALGDDHAGIREHAVRLSEGRAAASAELRRAMIARVDDHAYRVRLQLAFSLGEIDAPESRDALAALLRRDGGDASIRAAAMTSVAATAANLALRLLSDDDFLKERHASGVLSELARIAGAQPDDASPLLLLAAIGKLGDSSAPAAVRDAVVKSLGEGLRRRRSSIAQLTDGADDAAVRARVRTLFADAATTAADEKMAIAERRGAIGLLAYADADAALTALPALLTPRTAQEVQRAAVAALSAHADARVGDALLSAWKEYSPAVRGDALDALVQRRDRAEKLLAAVESKAIQPVELPREKRDLLLNHPDDVVRARARRVLGEANARRGEVIAKYRPSLELAGDAARGRMLFQKNCATCHKVGDEGTNVGPDLASTQNKSPGDLLISILDPNRESQPAFLAYTVVTDQGKLLTGIIVEESPTSITLRRPEGKEDVILRGEIEVLSSNGLSLMPEGLEKELAPQALADVIEFVRTIRPAER